MVSSLSGEEYLSQPAVGTKQNPASAPSVEGGWGGVLLAGATALAGVAADNPYAVAFGSDMGQSYHDSYDTLNKSLVEEQRANRLADASLARQKNLASFNRDLTAPDRALAQENWQKTYDYQAGRAEAEDARWEEGADARKTDAALKAAQLAEAQKTPEQRAKEQVEVAKMIAKAEQKIALDATAAQNAQQINHLESSLASMNVSPATIQRAKTQLMLKQAGIEVKAGEKPKAFSGEQKVKLQQTAKEEYLARPENQARLETEPAKVEAEADNHGVQTANAIEAQLNQAQVTDSLAATILAEVQSGKPAPGGESQKTGLGKGIAMFFKGQASAERLRASATTDEEKAAVEEAIQLATREDATYAPPPTQAQALTGELDTTVAQDETQALKQELQAAYDNATHNVMRQDILQRAKEAGLQLNIPEPSVQLTPQESAGIPKYVAAYTNATDAAVKSKIVKDLQKGLSPAAFKEFMRRVKPE